MKNYCCKFIPLFILLSLIFALAGCSSMTSDSSTPSDSSTLSYNRNSPEDTVEDFFESTKVCDLDKASTYLNNGDSYFSYENAEEEKLFKLCFSRLDYKIISSDVNNDSATVKMKVTAPDLVKIAEQAVDDLVPKLFDMLLYEGFENEEKVNKMITEAFSLYLSEPNLSYKTTEVDIKLVKDKNTDEWVIEPDEELANAFIGDVKRALNEFEKVGNDKKTTGYEINKSEESGSKIKSSGNNEKDVTESRNETIMINNESVIIRNESTSYETSQIDEELKKQLEDIFKKMEELEGIEYPE